MYTKISGKCVRRFGIIWPIWQLLIKGNTHKS